MDTFFEDFINHEEVCQHINNDGTSCHDCFQLLNGLVTSGYSQAQRYLPRRTCGNTIKNEDVEKLELPFEVLNTARELFETVCRNKVYRGSSRQSIIGGCIIHAYRFLDLYVCYKDLLMRMGLSIKKTLKGLQIIDLTLWEVDRLKYNQLQDNNLTFDQAIKDLVYRLGLTGEATGVDFGLWATRIKKNCRITTAAAVAIWLFCKERGITRITVEMVATAADLSLNTVKKNT